MNTNIIYIATGDGYGYEATWQSDDDFWGGVYSAGILKSIDGGITWMPTGLSYTQDNLEIVQRLIIHPTNPDILIAATRNGLFRTTDAGTTWLLVDEKHCYDLALNTTNPDIMYASSDDILISEDAGATWSILENNLCGAGRSSIENTAANSNAIYCLFEWWGLYKSSDGGVSWDSKNYPSTTFYGYYDMALEVSDLDENLLFSGGLEVARSTNGGNTWQTKSSWDNWWTDEYVHADNHAFACHPLDNNIVYSGNDGGIFESSDKGETWLDKSEDIRIAQIYRLSTSATDPSRILSGWQDNGCNLWDGTSLDRIQGADGMEVIIGLHRS